MKITQVKIIFNKHNGKTRRKHQQKKITNLQKKKYIRKNMQKNDI